MFNGDASTTVGKIDSKKVVTILKDTIVSNLKDEYFTKEKVDGLTKNTMKLTITELKQIIKNITTSLKDNQEFLNCFEKKEEIKEGLEDLLKEINEADTNEGISNIEVSIYTKGMKNEVEKFEIKLTNSKSEQMIMNMVETEKGKFVIDADIPEVGKVKLNIEVKNDTNTDIENVNVSDSVEINNMSQGDMLKLYGNLMNMKLYKYIAPLMQGGMMN